MKVGKLIKLLQQQDPRAEVLSGDHDGYFYDLKTVTTGHVVDGVEVDEADTDGGPLCVLIRP